MPTKWLQVRVNGSKYGSGIPPRRAFCGASREVVFARVIKAGVRVFGFTVEGLRMRVLNFEFELRVGGLRVEGSEFRV